MHLFLMIEDMNVSCEVIGKLWFISIKYKIIK